MSDYSALVEKIYSLRGAKNFKRGLERMQSCDSRLGNPSRAFPTIHIAGTNGKGSVATKIASGLQLSGKKVGLYTSPHLHSYCERIAINDVLISEAKVVELAEKLETFELSFFELTTLIAFQYFAEQKVDVAVIETGLGGRYDATNIIDPMLSIITRISLDHCDLLGGSIEEIAREKAGIIKTNKPVIIGPSTPRNLLREEAEKADSSCITVEGPTLTFDQENSAIASVALKQLAVAEEFIEEAIKVTPPCRNERMGSFVFDVAHNPDAIEALISSLSSPFEVVCGFSKGKDAASCLKMLSKEARFIHLVAPKDRSHHFSPEELLKSCSGHAKAYSSVEEGFLAAAKAKGDVVVCGSFTVVAEAKTHASSFPKRGVN